MVGTLTYVTNPKSNYEYPIVVHKGTGLLIVDFVEADYLQLIPSLFSVIFPSVAKNFRKSCLFSCPETMHVKLNYGFTSNYTDNQIQVGGAGLWFDFEGLDVEERHSCLVAKRRCLKTFETLGAQEASDAHPAAWEILDENHYVLHSGSIPPDAPNFSTHVFYLPQPAVGIREFLFRILRSSGLGKGIEVAQLMVFQGGADAK